MKKQPQKEETILHAGFPPPEPDDLPDVLKPKAPRDEEPNGIPVGDA